MVLAPLLRLTQNAVFVLLASSVAVTDTGVTAHLKLLELTVVLRILALRNR